MSLKNTSYFNPTLISGCTLWLDGADSSTITLSGSTVSQWTDKSTSGNHATQSTTGNQPSYASSGIVFAGNQWLITPIGVNPTAESFFIVFKTTNNLAEIFSGINGNSREVLVVSGVMYLSRYGTNPVGLTPNGGSVSTNTVTMFNYQYTSSFVTLNLNGTTSGSGTPPVTYSGTGTSYIGSSTYAPNNMYGSIYEIIYYNSSISDTQRKQIEGYLAWKWGLTLVLPSSHPYSVTPSYGLRSIVPNATAKTSITYANHPVVAIGGCALWFDGADPLGNGNAPANGTSLTTWVNKGITTVTLAHGTSQPTYSANFQNGLGSVSFNNNYFSAAYSFNLQTKSAFIVCSQSNNATDSPQGILSFYGSGLDTVNSTNGYGYQATQGGYGSFGWLYNIFAGGATGYYIATGTAGANTPMGIYGNVFSNQFEQTFKDGSSVTNFTITTTPGTSTNLMVGARLISGGLRGSFFGNICEIIVYNVALSTSQRQTIEGYLAQKWGLTANLPAGHPHKSSFPLFPSPVTGLRRVAGRRWSPLTPGGCVLWLDGSDSSTFTLSSTSITQWRDKSGNGNHMANNGTGPIYNRSLINSLGGIDCTNGGSLISSGFQNSANLSFAMVAVVKSGLGFWGSFFTHGGRDTDFAVERNSIVGTTIHFQTANDNSQCGIAYTVDAPVLYYGTMTSGTSRFFESFSGGTNTTTTGTNSSTISLGSQLARVGKSDNNEVCNSFIGEIIYYTAVLGATQQQQVEGYLAWKWGLRASLPSSHPYKLFPPSP